jgi:outer membrane lipase/esterase
MQARRWGRAGRLLLSLMVAAAVAGCAGGDDDPAPATAGTAQPAGNAGPPGAGSGAGDGTGTGTGTGNGDGTGTGTGTGNGDGSGGAPRNVQSVAAFGDSLSDVGTFRWGAIEAAGGGRFTTNPGPVWVELVASHYGESISRYRSGGAGNPSPEVFGGLGYAEGGARVAMLPGVGVTPSGIPGVSIESAALPVRDQIGAHLARGPVPASQLVLIFGGVNDVMQQVGGYFLMVADGINPILAQQTVVQETMKAATELADAVAGLVAAGARQLVVVDAPDLALMPYGVTSEPAVRETMTALTGVFNQTLGSRLDGVPGVHRIDIGEFLGRVIARPADFGFTDVERPACTAASLVCTSETLQAPDAATSFLYADGVHLTSGGHQQFARYVIERIAGAVPR